MSPPTDGDLSPVRKLRKVNEKLAAIGDAADREDDASESVEFDVQKDAGFVSLLAGMTASTVLATQGAHIAQQRATAADYGSFSGSDMSLSTVSHVSGIRFFSAQSRVLTPAAAEAVLTRNSRRAAAKRRAHVLGRVRRYRVRGCGAQAYERAAANEGNTKKRTRNDIALPRDEVRFEVTFLVDEGALLRERGQVATALSSAQARVIDAQALFDPPHLRHELSPLADELAESLSLLDFFRNVSAYCKAHEERYALLARVREALPDNAFVLPLERMSTCAYALAEQRALFSFVFSYALEARLDGSDVDHLESGSNTAGGGGGTQQQQRSGHGNAPFVAVFDCHFSPSPRLDQSVVRDLSANVENVIGILGVEQALIHVCRAALAREESGDGDER